MKKKKKKQSSGCNPDKYNSQVFAELITACFELDQNDKSAIRISGSYDAISDHAFAKKISLHLPYPKEKAKCQPIGINGKN